MRGVPQVINPLIVIVWVSLKIESVSMLSVCLHVILYRKKPPKSSHHINISDELKLTNNCQEFIMFFATWVLRGLLNCLKSFVRPYQIFLGSRWHWYIRTLPIHAKIAAFYIPKMQKMSAKSESLLLFHHLSHFDDCLTFVTPFVRSQPTMFWL